LVVDLNSNFITKELELVSTGVEGERLLLATVTSSSPAAAVGTVSWALSVGRRDMSMSTARAAPREEMLCRLYVVGYCGVTTGTFVTLFRSRRHWYQKKALVK
jgi:hypothetical protein